MIEETKFINLTNLEPENGGVIITLEPDNIEDIVKNEK
jgi:hypothetical protein